MSAAPVPNTVKVSAGRLFNIGFPLLILVPLLIDLILIFVIPTETTIKAISPLPNLQKMVETVRTTGDVSFFKLRSPINSGRLRPA